VQTLIQTTQAELGLEQHSELFVQHVAHPLWWSLALGACLGANGTLFGAAANIVVAQVARRNGYTLSFRDFLRFGAPVMLATLVLSSIYIYLRYFAFSPM